MPKLAERCFLGICCSELVFSLNRGFTTVRGTIKKARQEDSLQVAEKSLDRHFGALAGMSHLISITPKPNADHLSCKNRLLNLLKRFRRCYLTRDITRTMNGPIFPVQPGSEGCPPKVCTDEVSDEDEGHV